MKLTKLVEETFQLFQKVNENIFTISHKVEEKILKVIKLWNWESSLWLKNVSAGCESLMNLIKETIEVKAKSLINIHLVFAEKLFEESDFFLVGPHFFTRTFLGQGN